jgi:hypothetical protein
LLVVLALLLACSFDEESGAQEQALIDRFVNAKIRLRQHPSSAEANQEANEALRALIENESLEGDRALVALAGHYLGESSEPECEILRRGERMISLLKEADERPQKVDLPKSDLHSRKGLAEAIRKGEVCE